MTHVMITSQNDTKNSDDIVPMAQEPSSGSGVKRFNLEAIRRADAEAEKALKRAQGAGGKTSSETSICNTDG